MSSTRSRTARTMRLARTPTPASGARPGAAASLLFLAQREVVRHAVGQLLNDLIELRAGEGGDLDRHVLNLGARVDPPALDLAEKVERGCRLLRRHRAQ